jgi:O-methyltransferase
MSAPPVSVVCQNTIAELVSYARQTPAGAFVEVGVYQGGTAWHLASVAREQGRELFLYDTFTGIPHSDTDKDVHKVGDFGDTSIEQVREAIPDATVVQGIFPASAVRMPQISFAHVDCDQYQSIVETSEYLIPLMVPGGMIWFDDYNCLSGATQAVDRVFGGRVQQAPTSHKAFVLF